jgi:putative oligomerization/nucleic acid binding protein
MPLLRMAARTAVVAGTATAVSGRVARRQQGRYAEQDQQAYDEQQQAAPPQYAEPAPAPPAEESLTDKLTQLAQLHTQGILTDDEFAAAKAKAIG